MQPQDPLGRGSPPAIAATDSALVLVASMTSGGAAASSARKIVCLSREILQRRLDHDLRLRAGDGVEACASRKPASRPETQSSIAVRVQVETSGASPQAVADARATALDRGFIDVVEHDLVARLERELGDPGAHGPGSDHPDDPRSAAPVRST